MNDYTPTTDEIRRAWWMDTDNPFDNEGASDVSFDRWLAAHDAALLAAQREKDASIAEGHGSASGDVIGDWIRADEASGVLGNTEGNNP